MRIRFARIKSARGDRFIDYVRIKGSVSCVRFNAGYRCTTPVDGMHRGRLAWLANPPPSPSSRGFARAAPSLAIKKQFSASPRGLWHVWTRIKYVCVYMLRTLYAFNLCLTIARQAHCCVWIPNVRAELHCMPATLIGLRSNLCFSFVRRTHVTSVQSQMINVKVYKYQCT